MPFKTIFYASKHVNADKDKEHEMSTEEAEDIKLIYQLYSKHSATLGDVCRELSKRGININRRGNLWSTARLSEIMRNPVYTFADQRLIIFLKSSKAILLIR